MPKLSFKKKSNDTIEPTAEDIGRLILVWKGISMKVNVIAWLEVEPVYLVATVQHVDSFLFDILK